MELCSHDKSFIEKISADPRILNSMKDASAFLFFVIREFRPQKLGETFTLFRSLINSLNVDRISFTVLLQRSGQLLYEELYYLFDGICAKLKYEYHVFIH